MLSGPWKEANPPNSPSDSEDDYSIQLVIKSEEDMDSQSAVESDEDMDLEYIDTLTTPSAVLTTGPSLSSPSRYFPEGQCITTTGWHAYALWVVLHIIHGHFDHVPETVSLEFVTHIAVIANYYQCTEAVSLTVKFWLHVSFETPKCYGKEAIIWLCISWIFS
ncbi:hypothetical protein HYE68_005472 [Fusarium pseudograminearum]|nr:hypothetical protein HYE68_005472 [Fusarium pseudograminearum]